mgnify:CR=1 FL=1
MKKIFYLVLLAALAACTSGDESTSDSSDNSVDPLLGLNLPTSPYNYSSQTVPGYITKDNTPLGETIDDDIATLGRVLFYDTNLSVNNSVSCASCHQQSLAFSDDDTQSSGLSGGLTGRHAMRLINARFANESRFFWDERAVNLEDQVTQPIQDHIEMGFSGENGDPNFDDLITRMNGLSYYPVLFTYAFESNEINENRIQRALSQFVRSIQSFDSKYDQGRANTPNDQAPFPNFSPEENLGKTLFLNPPNLNGAGCAGCHAPPEFSIDPQSLNNGVIATAGSPAETDLTNTRAPSLRDVTNGQGILNGPLMHNGAFSSLIQVVNHYNSITANDNIDNRLLGPNNQGLQLNLTENEKQALVAFLNTLSGSNVYTDIKWSDPFE